MIKSLILSLCQNRSVQTASTKYNVHFGLVCRQFMQFLIHKMFKRTRIVSQEEDSQFIVDFQRKCF